ncbi:MAG: threonylcarbamoyl-AMP synthase, partial [Saprospiraceae bacterium]|nr:threonylcarbamoyl-AMP synthase [Saprospiraceae bacterium]
PGPYTFILQASSKVPKIFDANKKSVGIRVPNNNIAREIVSLLGNPIISASLKDPDEILEYPTDPELIFDRYRHIVDVVIDGGVGGNIPSTIANHTGEDWEVIREGAGDVSLFY